MKNPKCPHCEHELSRWSTPTFNFADGSGWCTPWLYICFNDECMYFLTSFRHMQKTYGQRLGYRYMLHPDSNESGAIPVATILSLKGDIIDESTEEREEMFKREREWRSRGGE